MESSWRLGARSWSGNVSSKVCSKSITFGTCLPCQMNTRAERWGRRFLLRRGIRMGASKNRSRTRLQGFGRLSLLSYRSYRTGARQCFSPCATARTANPWRGRRSRRTATGNLLKSNICVRSTPLALQGRPMLEHTDASLDRSSFKKYPRRIVVTSSS